MALALTFIRDRIRDACPAFGGRVAAFPFPPKASDAKARFQVYPFACIVPGSTDVAATDPGHGKQVPTRAWLGTSYDVIVYLDPKLPGQNDTDPVEPILIEVLEAVWGQSIDDCRWINFDRAGFEQLNAAEVEYVICFSVTTALELVREEPAGAPLSLAIRGLAI